MRKDSKWVDPFCDVWGCPKETDAVVNIIYKEIIKIFRQDEQDGQD